MNYCKLTTDKHAHMMPNPVSISFANPTDEQKAKIADLDNWLEMVYTNEPSYDPETQYITSYWEEENGQAVQHWEIHEKPPEEPTIEERVGSLEDNVSDIVNGVTE